MYLGTTTLDLAIHSIILVHVASSLLFSTTCTTANNYRINANKFKVVVLGISTQNSTFFHSSFPSLVAYDSTPHAHSKDGVVRRIQLSELSIVRRHLLPVANARLTAAIDFAGTRSGKNVVIS